MSKPVRVKWANDHDIAQLGNSTELHTRFDKFWAHKKAAHVGQMMMLHN